jgi:hypothetical protein
MLDASRIGFLHGLGRAVYGFRIGRADDSVNPQSEIRNPQSAIESIREWECA